MHFKFKKKEEKKERETSTYEPMPLSALLHISGNYIDQMDAFI